MKNFWQRYFKFVKNQAQWIDDLGPKLIRIATYKTKIHIVGGKCLSDCFHRLHVAQLVRIHCYHENQT